MNRILALGTAGLALVGGLVLVQMNAAPSLAETATASQCSKLAEADCANASGCVWLPGYPVAGGGEVKGYCRPAPKPLNARRTPSNAP